MKLTGVGRLSLVNIVVGLCFALIGAGSYLIALFGGQRPVSNGWIIIVVGGVLTVVGVGGLLPSLRKRR